MAQTSPPTPITEEMQQWMQAQAVSDRPVIAGLPLAGKFSLYINHRPQPSAVKTVPALDSAVKSKQNQSYLQLCVLAGLEARKIHTLKLQFDSFSSVFYITAITTCKRAPRIPQVRAEPQYI